MHKILVGTSVLRCGNIRYYLSCSFEETGGKTYGVLVEYLGEKIVIPDLSASKQNVLDLLIRMRRGCVTPVTVRDVVEDWLLSLSL